MQGQKNINKFSIIRGKVPVSAQHNPSRPHQQSGVSLCDQTDRLTTHHVPFQCQSGTTTTQSIVFDELTNLFLVQ